MWQLDNRTPFAAERTWVRDREGAEIWLVAVKATFDLAGRSTLTISKEQPPVTMAPIYMGKTGASSVRYDCDLVRTKLVTDVVIIGCAHAPHGERVQELDVGFSVGPLTKRVRVIGDRRWARGGKSASRPTPFERMPLVYERAYGGHDPSSRDLEKPSFDVRNPVGAGWAERVELVYGLMLPNIEDPRQPIERWDDRPAPAGFGVVAPHWQPRAALAGTYDDDWQQSRLPLLPRDFDDRHYQCVPADQQSPQFLRGGEPVTLSNLTPSGGEFAFVLPRVHMGFETFFYTGERIVHPPAKLHTVFVEPDAGRVALVFHTSLHCHAKVLKLKHTRITLKQDLRDGVLAPLPVA